MKFNEVCVERYTGRYEFYIAPNFVAVHNHRFMRSSNNKRSKTSFEKNCFSAWASTLNMGLINKVDMVCLSPVGYGV